MIMNKEVDEIIELYGGWKGQTLSQLRAAVHQADPEVVEEVKWRMKSRPEGLPVWYHSGIMCLVETFNDNIKLLFAKGAFMKDYQQHFNARLNSKTDRAIMFQEDDKVDKALIKKLVREAVRLNESKK